jgi:small subunit ribosomal protein S1
MAKAADEAATTLGDANSALQELKDKMEADAKK